VLVVHGTATRKALDAAGHAAATTERTIHLPSRPDSSTRTMSIVAHELEHVAAPSPVPRFHGGIDSPEERRATAMEQTVRRLAATGDHTPPQPGDIARLPVAGIPAFARANPVGADGDGGPAVPASALGGHRAGGESGTGGDIRRSAAGAPTRSLIARELAPDADSDVGGGSMTAPPPSVPGSSGSSDSSTPAALSPAQLSAIIRAVEDRLLEEIERRGGLGRGAF
jgi:hypothetical protein